jgi:dTDP-4-dehydrorhamnose reductase
MKYPKIFLTGSTGQVGYRLKKELKIFGKIFSPNRKEFDLTNFKSIRKIIRSLKPNLIVNAAAYTKVDLAEVNFALASKINAEAPKILAEEALKLNIPLIHFSTDYVFDGTLKRSYKEDDAPNPINNYGKSKLAGEYAIKKKYNHFIIIRTSWVYDTNRGKNFYQTILKLFKEKKEIQVVNDQYGCPTSTQFLAKKITKILNQLNLNLKDESRWGTYHLTEHKVMTWFDFAKKIFIREKLSINNKKFKIIPISSKDYPVLAKRPANSVLDLKKIKSSFSL